MIIFYIIMGKMGINTIKYEMRSWWWGELEKNTIQTF